MATSPWTRFLLLSQAKRGSASPDLLWPAGELLLRRGWRCGRRRRVAGRIGKEAEELRIRPQQEAGVVAAQSGLVGRHRAVEREELGVPAIGVGEQTVAFGIAGATGLFGGRIGLRDDDGRLTIGLGLDLLRLLAALGTELGGFPRAFGLHALVDRL